MQFTISGGKTTETASLEEVITAVQWSDIVVEVEPAPEEDPADTDTYLFDEISGEFVLASDGDEVVFVPLTDTLDGEGDTATVQIDGETWIMQDLGEDELIAAADDEAPSKQNKKGGKVKDDGAAYSSLDAFEDPLV